MIKLQNRYYTPEVETASVEELKAIQTVRLIRTVKHCYKNVPFYKKKFDELGITPDDIKSLDDLPKLPFTVKQDLRDNYPFGLLAVPKEDLYRIQASSGTTGKQTVAGYTKEDIDMWGECTARAIVAAGGTKEDFIHVSYGYGLFTGGFGLHAGAEAMGCTVIPVSSGNTERQVNILKDFGSDILCCTPSYALYIGEHVRDKGIDPKTLKVRAGIFGAEPWTDNMRKEIEKLLGIKAHDIYGLTEICGPGVSFECEEQTGMHINEDYFLPEIIDPETGKQLPEGSTGELVFTTIQKYGMPLIRYRTRDICTLTREKCSCGRTLIKMSRVTGRTDDMLIIRGVNVFPSQVEHVLLELGLTAPYYMLIVDRHNNMDTLEIEVEMTEEMFSDSVRKIEETANIIKNAMASYLGITATIKMVEPKSIPRSEGKAKRIIDKRKFI